MRVPNPSPSAADAGDVAGAPERPSAADAVAGPTSPEPTGAPGPDLAPDPDPDLAPGPDAVAAAAVAEQERLRGMLLGPGAEPVDPRFACGVDVAYENGGDRYAAAAVIVDLATGATVEEATATGRAPFPYVPGLLAFREIPALLKALAGLESDPGVIVCDGHGLAHPRGFGLACHLGVLLDLPTVGVAKNPPWPTPAPGPDRGDHAPITHDGSPVGDTLRTRTGVRPVYVSPGHRIGGDEARSLVLALASRHRQPETTRRADHRCRAELRRLVG